MQELIEIISTVGFPIAVTVYLLYERQKNITTTFEENTKALIALKIAVEKLAAKLM